MVDWHVLGAVHPHDLGTHVRKHHGCEGAGPDACDLDHADALKRSHLSFLPCSLDRNVTLQSIRSGEMWSVV